MEKYTPAPSAISCHLTSHSVCIRAACGGAFRSRRRARMLPAVSSETGIPDGARWRSLDYTDSGDPRARPTDENMLGLINARALRGSRSNCGLFEERARVRASRRLDIRYVVADAEVIEHDAILSVDLLN